MEVIFSDRAYAAVLAETAEKIKTETGGLFLGTVIGDTWYIVEAIDPGPKSVFEVAYFEYDRAYTQHLIRKIANLYAKKLDLIGLWHRHPGSFDIFSVTDNGTNAKYAAMRSEGAISALVNIDPDFRITMYHVGAPCRYAKIPYRIGDRLFPPGLLELRSHEQFERLMKNTLRPGSVPPPVRESADLGAFMRSVVPYLEPFSEQEDPKEGGAETETLAERFLDALADDLAFFSEKAGLAVSLARRGDRFVLLQERGSLTTALIFSYADRADGFVFAFDGKSYRYAPGCLRQAYEKLTAEPEQPEPEQQPEQQPEPEPEPEQPEEPKPGAARHLLQLFKRRSGGEHEHS